MVVFNQPADRFSCRWYSRCSRHLSALMQLLKCLHAQIRCFLFITAIISMTLAINKSFVLWGICLVSLYLKNVSNILKQKIYICRARRLYIAGDIIVKILCQLLHRSMGHGQGISNLLEHICLPLVQDLITMLSTLIIYNGYVAEWWEHDNISLGRWSTTTSQEFYIIKRENNVLRWKVLQSAIIDSC